MKEEYDNFLQKVEEVSSIMKGLTSKDRNVAGKAIQKADLFLRNSDEKCEITSDGLKIKTNKTVINKKAFESNPMQNNEASPEAFMAHIEKDVKARAADRKERKAIADEYKKKANEAFRAQDYEKALDYYNKAIEQVRDSCLLYTNRALTCLNLQLYSRAISDCEWAHKVNENNLKAWLYKARAHHEIGEDDEAAHCIKEAEKRNPESKREIQEYISLWKPRQENN
ncbi:tetratricopeptide repeat protein 12-like [Periplaneta americana]|uniref:tetratricopeptide repeat protein 12-like n=1 Tax=Periplaneta americana TaxID=6978 RepID=UPI0037E7E9A5